MAIGQFGNIEKESSTLELKFKRMKRTWGSVLLAAGLLFSVGSFGSSAAQGNAEQQTETTQQMVDYVTGDSNDFGVLEGPTKRLSADLKAYVDANGDLEGFVGAPGKYSGVTEAFVEAPFQESSSCTECGILTSSFQKIVETGDFVSVNTEAGSGLRTVRSVALPVAAVGMLGYLTELLRAGRKIVTERRPVILSEHNPYLGLIDSKLLRAMFVKMPDNIYEKEMVSRTKSGSTLVDIMWKAHIDDRYNVEDCVALYDRLTLRVGDRESGSDEIAEALTELQTELDTFDAAMSELDRYTPKHKNQTSNKTL